MTACCIIGMHLPQQVFDGVGSSPSPGAATRGPAGHLACTSRERTSARFNKEGVGAKATRDTALMTNCGNHVTESGASAALAMLTVGACQLPSGQHHVGVIADGRRRWAPQLGRRPVGTRRW
jgi:hypothetical protein